MVSERTENMLADVLDEGIVTHLMSLACRKGMGLSALWQVCPILRKGPDLIGQLFAHQCCYLSLAA
jgi:hypothetical protein